jgi:hypothetical protein
LLESGVLLEIVVASHRKQIGLVGAVGIEPRSGIETTQVVDSTIRENRQKR